MKNVIFLILVILCAGFHINAQEKKNPDEHIVINKKYDDKGNLIRYDSTYFHQWSSDSTIRFDFDFSDRDFFAGKGFDNMDSMLKKFFGDSVHFNIPGMDKIPFPDFGDEDFPNDFISSFYDDSTFVRRFNFDADSLFYRFKSDSLGIRHHDPNKFFFDKKNNSPLNFFFQFPDRNFGYEHFDDPKQQKEWQELMNKQQKELEDFLKKWMGIKKE